MSFVLSVFVSHLIPILLLLSFIFVVHILSFYQGSFYLYSSFSFRSLDVCDVLQNSFQLECGDVHGHTVSFCFPLFSELRVVVSSGLSFLFLALPIVPLIWHWLGMKHKGK
jgi:hypothetical protein